MVGVCRPQEYKYRTMAGIALKMQGTSKAMPAPAGSRLLIKGRLESDKRLKIPARVWLAFLCPHDFKTGKKTSRECAEALSLKRAVLATLKDPQKFMDGKVPSRGASRLVTLVLLELTYKLTKEKPTLPRGIYEGWLEVANRFGLWKLRYVLEDAVFKAFEAENFSLFESVVKKQMSLDAEFIGTIRKIVSDALKRDRLSKFSIENRTKNIYGVYKKVALKGKSINDIYDIHGWRILMRTPKECRRALGVLHRLWPHFPERYKDYISKPKANGYQSIHTVLSCLEKKRIEFQIRTYEMDLIAASGPANHADYKRALEKKVSP